MTSFDDPTTTVSLSPVAAAHAATVRGSGPRTFVMAHGLGGDQTQWDAVVDVLVPTSTIVTFDLAGSGRSDVSRFDHVRHGEVGGFADDLAVLVNHLGLRGSTFVGHSVSGMAGLLASAADPGLFSRLVLVGATARYLDDPATGYVGGFDQAAVDALLESMRADYTAWAGGFARLVMQNEDRPLLGAEFARRLGAYPPDVALTVFRAAFFSDYRSVVPRVAVPVLVVSTTGDPAVPVDAARWLADNLPQGTLDLVDATGHFPHLVAPGRIAEAIDRFSPVS